MCGLPLKKQGDNSRVPGSADECRVLNSCVVETPLQLANYGKIYMHLLALLVAVSLRSKLPVLSHRSLDSICSTLSATIAALGSVEGLYSVERLLVALHGDGSVLMQSTSQQLGAQSSKQTVYVRPASFASLPAGAIPYRLPHPNKVRDK
jgi:hypothetical protein